MFSQLPEALFPARYALKARLQYLRDLGPAIAPLNAFLFLQGLETLSLRMERHVANATAVANWLSPRDEVSWVNYAGLASSPWHARAQERYLPQGAGSILASGSRGAPTAGAVSSRGSSCSATWPTWATSAAWSSTRPPPPTRS